MQKAVFSNSETNVAEKINELKKKGYDCFIFDKVIGDNYMVAVINKAQIVKDKPTVVQPIKKQNSDREESISTEELYDLMGENEKLKKRVQVLTEDSHKLGASNYLGGKSLTIENYTTDYTRFNSSGATINYFAIGGGEE